MTMIETMIMVAMEAEKEILETELNLFPAQDFEAFEGFIRKYAVPVIAKSTTCV